MSKLSQFLISILLIAFAIPISDVSGTNDVNYSEVLKKVGHEISALRKDYPQLADFSPAKHVQLESLRISYEYKTHEPPRRAGWMGGVPHPDPDGIWFYIDFHDPKSTAQIHTQPVVPKGMIGDKTVMFLILEGDKTKRLSGKLWEILRNNGITVKDFPSKRD